MNLDVQEGAGMDEEPLSIADAALRAALERAGRRPVNVIAGQLVLDLPADAPQLPAVHALLAGRDGWQITSAPDGGARVTINLRTTP